MNVIEKKICTKDYLTKSNLPSSDYVINPYAGCTHACRYCYARFMKRFTGHNEAWGEFIDIKECKLVNADYEITIATKSTLILRDIDVLQKLSRLKAAFSINTLNETFRADMDHGSSIKYRIHAIEVLHPAGIHTILFMSPIFPYITEWKEIIDCTKNIVSEYWFENLNLRGSFKSSILTYINNHYPNLKDEYEKIYLQKDTVYWHDLADSLNTYCEKSGLNYVNYFYHGKLVKEKLEKTNLQSI